MKDAEGEPNGFIGRHGRSLRRDFSPAGRLVGQAVRVAFLGTLAGLAGWVSADVLVMHNGDRLTGQLVGMIGQRFTFETEYAGSLVVDRNAVAHVETDEEFEIVDETGERRMAVLTETLPLEPVAVIRRNRRRALSLVDAWQTHVDLSASAATGSRDARDFRVLAESVLRRGRIEHLLRLDLLGEEVDGATTGDVLDVDYGLKLSMGPAWYLAGNAQYYQDRLKGIARRVALGGSLGRRLRDTSFERWSVELGVSQVLEERGGDDSSGPALRWGFDYGRSLRGTRLEVFHNHGVLVRAESERGMSIDASTGIRYHLGDWWNANARVDVRHETKPPEGSAGSDVTYAIGLGLRF